MNKILELFKKNWKQIIFSYVLWAINAILIFSYPKILGDTIDHLVLKDYWYSWHLVAIFVSFMFFGYVSRVYDTKVFSKIYRRFASVETNKQIKNNVDSSKINGRLNLMNGIISFFERDMTLVIQSIFGMVVSVYFLSLVSPTIVFFILISSVVMFLLVWYFSPKIAELTAISNDIYEEQTSVVGTLKINLINNLLRRSQKYKVKMSNLDAKYFIVIEFIVYFVVTALTIYYVTNNKVTIGSVFSTYRYMFDFCNSVLGLTNLFPAIINIKDVVGRLNSENC